ncbi:hypothetical protein FRC07_015090, partial [Ceratobasidium sp. 392]
MFPKLRRRLRRNLENVLRRESPSRGSTYSDTLNSSQIYDKNSNYATWEGLEFLAETLDQLNNAAVEPLVSAVGRFSRCRETLENQARTREEYAELGTDMNDLFFNLAQRFEGAASLMINSETITAIARGLDMETQLLLSKNLRTEDTIFEEEEDMRDTENGEQIMKCYGRVRTLLALFV